MGTKTNKVKLVDKGKLSVKQYQYNVTIVITVALLDLLV
jgi:hypothetical protein